jgi:PAS domain S-box-containing protein
VAAGIESAGVPRFEGVRPMGRTLSHVLRTVLTVLLFAAAFCAVQRLTFALRFPPFRRATIWTPGALPFAALLLAPPRRWWVYFVGLCLGIFAAFYGDSAVPLAAAMLTVPLLFTGVAIGAWAIRRFCTSPTLENPISLMVFVALATVLVPLVSATPTAVGRFFSGADDVWEDLVRFWPAAALGTLIATPALTLTLANGVAWLRAASWRRNLEVAGLAIGLAAAGFVCFQKPTGMNASPALLYAPLPLLLWAAVRFELAGVSWALLLLAFQSTWGAVHGRGPFATQEPSESVFQLQLFILAVSLPLMFLATAIQERRQASAALSKAEQEVRRDYALLATIYQTAPVGLAFVDAQLRYVSINDHLAEINGRPAGAHLGRTVREVLPHLADTLEPIYRRVLATGQPVLDVEVQDTTSRPGSGRTWLASRYPVKDPQGTILGVSTVVQEITERKQAEEARQELAHASRLALLGELTASIAHEINQPLGAILSNADAAEMLLASSPPALDPVREILGDIRRDDLRASEVIGRLRALLRKRAMEVQPVSLNEVVSDVVALVRAESRRRGVVVAVQPAGDLPPVRGDRVHLQQVLMNLVLNGMDALADVPREKRLTVRTGVKENGSVEIAVSDTGPGILPDRLPRLFDPFFSTKKDGMGLGLSIARSLVETHGGQIWAENNHDGGATFRFSLPTGREPAHPESRSTPQAPAGAYT